MSPWLLSVCTLWLVKNFVTRVMQRRNSFHSIPSSPFFSCHFPIPPSSFLPPFPWLFSFFLFSLSAGGSKEQHFRDILSPGNVSGASSRFVWPLIKVNLHVYVAYRSRGRDDKKKERGKKKSGCERG